MAILYKLSGGDTPMILFGGAVSAFALWGFVKLSLLLAWAIWLCAASTARFILARAYRRVRPGTELASRWENIFCLVSSGIGAAWGITILFLTPVNPSLQDVIVMFLLSSITMGLPPSLAASPKAFAGFILPIVAPMVAMMFTSSSGLYTTAGLLLLVFTGVLITIYVSANQALLASIAYGKENERLLKAHQKSQADLERARERIDLAIQSSALCIWEWSSEQRGFFFDAAWAMILGRPPAESRPSPEQLQELLHPEDAQAFERARLECFEGVREVFTSDVRARSAAGDWVWMNFRGRIVTRDAAGAPLRMAGTAINVTQRKRAESEMFAALQREKELNEMKSKFVSIASHELRTPLTAILSSAELLEHYSATLSAQDRNGMLSNIRDGVGRMTALIDDVLVMGRSGSGKLKCNPVALNMRELCQGIVESLRKGQGRAHRLDFDCRLTREDRYADEQLVRHILNNLLSNAAKYSPEGSAVSLALREQGEEVVLEVSDQGIGIPENDRPQLFESFHRGSNVGDRPGTGLGLAIVKTAAELHRGRVAVASKPGAGTTFTVTLQASPA